MDSIDNDVWFTCKSYLRYGECDIMKMNLEYKSNKSNPMPKLNMDYKSEEMISSVDLNLDYDPITEASAGGSGGIGAFTGKAGQDIDDVFAGGFLATDNIIIDLEQQLIDTQLSREFTDKWTPPSDVQWKHLPPNFDIDKVLKRLDKDIELLKNPYSDRYLIVKLNPLSYGETDKDLSKKLKKGTKKSKKLRKKIFKDVDMSIYKNDTDQWKPIGSLKKYIEDEHAKIK